MPDADYQARLHRSSCAHISAPVTALRKYDRSGNLLQTINSNTNAGNNWGAEFAVPSDGGCPADLDGDGDVDADDFFAYLDAFANGDLSICDIDGDGDCDADDFFGYLDLFAQGC